MNVHVIAVCKASPGMQFAYRTGGMTLLGACLFVANWRPDELLSIVLCDGGKWCNVGADCAAFHSWELQQ